MSIKTSNKGKINDFCYNRFSLSRGLLLLITFQDLHCQLGRSRKDPVALTGLSFHVLLQLNSLLKTLDQPPLSVLLITNRNEFAYLKSHQEKMAFLNSPARFILRPLPSPPPLRFCTDERTDGHHSYGDVITKFSRLDELPIFLTHVPSLARFAR